MPATLHDPALESLALFGLHPRDTQEGIRYLLDGLPAEGWDRLLERLGVGERRLAWVVRIPPTTLHRRKQSGRFTPEESERLWRLARLVAHAAQVFRTPEGVARWFSQPNRALGGATPLEYARTPLGAEEVERVLERILDGGPA